MRLSELRKAHDLERYEMRQRLARDGIDPERISELVTERSRAQIITEEEQRRSTARAARERTKKNAVDRTAREYKAAGVSFDPRRANLAWRLRKYGLTLLEYDSLLEQQGNRCSICRTNFSHTIRVAVDHCHRSQRVRGLLCNACNSMLGFAHDDAESLQRAALYLRGELDKQWDDDMYA